MSNYLDGYYLMEQSPLPSLYGQAQGLLTHATGSVEVLREYVKGQLEGLAMAKEFLSLRK
jgi:isopentenyl-diphosphate delta-isomerase